MSQIDLHADVHIGRVCLRVADLERSTAFYRDVLDFRTTVDGRALGLPVVLLTAGDGQHHVVLTSFGGTAAAPVPRGHLGMGHFAVGYADPLALTEAVLRVFDREYPISHAADHGGTVSIYLLDPDDNGVELYYDRPEGFLDSGGHGVVRSEPFDPADLTEVLARRRAA